MWRSKNETKKCHNVKCVFALWPLEPLAACIVLFPEPVDILAVSRRAARPRLQHGSRRRLMLTAAVMQPSLQKGAFPPAHQLTHFTGKLLPELPVCRTDAWTDASNARVQLLLLLWSTHYKPHECSEAGQKSMIHGPKKNMKTKKETSENNKYRIKVRRKNVKT